jgi:4-hydroxy-3-polyprenylbenzoate decarboxylase
MYIIGITGASGSIIGLRCAVELLHSGFETFLIISNAGKKTCNYELNKDKTENLDIQKTLKELGLKDNSLLRIFDNDDFFSPIASGANLNNGMIIAPASMKTVASIAHGLSDNLITRAADVNLKENRPLILLPRESPLNLIHLKNLTKLKEAGADIHLPVTAFYNFPETIDDVINTKVARIFQGLGLKSRFSIGWNHE